MAQRLPRTVSDRTRVSEGEEDNNMLEAFSTEITKTKSAINFQTGRICPACRSRIGWHNMQVDGCTIWEEGKKPITRYVCGSGFHELTLMELLQCDTWSISKRIGTV
jgi:hypothetical protein